MSANQLFYGKLSAITPQYENIVITTGDFVNGSYNFTIANPQLARIGQTLTYINSQFTGTVTIVSINGSTVTVDKPANANADVNQPLGLNTPNGEYLISSASFLDPQNNLSVNDITGSSDPDFIEGSTIYTLIGSAATLGGIYIPGKYYSYKIKEVVSRDIATANISAFISFNQSGSEEGTGNTLFKGSNQTLPIVSISPSASLLPTFNTAIAGLSDLPAGSDVAAYQIAINEYFDDLPVDIFYTGSKVKGNVEFINFSGSGVEDITISQSADGKTGVEVKLRDISDPFPYTGSAEITGSLGVTGSVEFNTQEGGYDFFILKSGSIENFKVNGEGVTQFFAYANDYEPTPVLGGFYFTSASAYLGLE